MMRSMMLESFLFYGGGSLLGLLLLKEIQALVEFPEFLSGYANYLWSFHLDFQQEVTAIALLKLFVVYLVPLHLVFTSLLNLILVFRNHKFSDRQETPGEIAEINHLIPRNRDEKLWVSLLSLNAGISEELFFRLFLPLLIYSISGSVWVALLIATLWFGLAHAYQGLGGIISTFIAGAMLCYIFLLTQSIWITIGVHVLLDLNGLIFTPGLRDYLARSEPVTIN